MKGILDRAEAGGIAVIDRHLPVVVMSRSSLDRLLAVAAPFNVKVAVDSDGVAMWMDGLPLHGSGGTMAEAEDDFLDELVVYAHDWVANLHRAPNHAANEALVQRVQIYASDREELRAVVFAEGDE